MGHEIQKSSLQAQLTAMFWLLAFAIAISGCKFSSTRGPSVPPGGDPNGGAGQRSSDPANTDGKNEGSGSRGNAAVGPCFRDPGSRPNAENLHIVAIEGPVDDKAEIVVKQTSSPVTLVLAAPDVVQWKIILDATARVERVVLWGRAQSTVIGLVEGTIVERRSGSFGYGWEPRHNTLQIQDQGGRQVLRDAF